MTICILRQCKNQICQKYNFQKFTDENSRETIPISKKHIMASFHE